MILCLLVVEIILLGEVLTIGWIAIQQASTTSDTIGPLRGQQENKSKGFREMIRHLLNEIKIENNLKHLQHADT